MEHTDFVVVLQYTAAEGSVDPTKSDHAECVQFGGSQRPHAGGAANRDAALQSKQNFLLPHRRDVAEVTIDDTNHLIARQDCPKDRSECRGRENVRLIGNSLQPRRPDKYANL